MIFNSMAFMVFFVLVGGAFFALPHRHRWPLLLVTSYYFYMCWEPYYALLILFTTLVNYLCALELPRCRTPGRRKALLALGVCVSLAVLFAFKYWNFAAAVVDDASTRLHWPIHIPALDVLLPVGISFFTFQTLSYTIDVYRGHMPPERHFGIFALYVVFFPQLVAGPIERGIHLLPQFRVPMRWDTARAWDGLQLIAWGLFKKVVIADRVALYVNSVYNHVPDHTGPSYLLATYLFAFQIYCDFSGYSDIAVGSARVLGFELMENFNRPYFATTITEFWRRWHISLSTWLRDYLYIPLGGNRLGTTRTYVNLLITMFLGGIWHGAAWTFVIWGLLQGVMLCGSKLTLSARDRLSASLGLPVTVRDAIRMLVTFHLVCLSWVLFRANSLHDAWHILTHIGQGWPKVYTDPAVLAQGLAAVALLVAVQVVQTRVRVREWLARRSLPVRWTAYSGLLFWIVLFGVDGGAAFIYFQF